jgi:predicted nuclease of predicted toxin-antitoxin system
MKFKIDENLPVEAAELLRQAGYDAATVHEENLVGKPDADIASVCQTEKRAIITLDTDFADIRTYPPDQFSGLIVLRLKQQDKFYVLKIFERILKLLSDELEGRLWIVDEKHVRVKS